MKEGNFGALQLAGAIAVFATLACNLGSAITPRQPAIPDTATPVVPVSAVPVMTSTVVVTHVTLPSSPPGWGTLVYDVTSQDTAARRCAPYGDSYDINRLERPFLQDMTYVPDLDTVTYMVADDGTWWYVSIKLIGDNPNNDLGINYGVELDLDHDGFGDYLIWTHPPYSATWDTAPVQIFQDKNHNTSGVSAEKSDAPITTDGYETLIFNGGVGDADPDMAWVRINAGPQATVQFAFKKSWSGGVFMLGVLADAGLKDPKKLDYVDRFTFAEAGSPVCEYPNYPLKALFAVDNVCREAYGFIATGYEPQLCPKPEAVPTKKPRSTEPPPTGCQPPPSGCGSHSEWHGEPECRCVEVLY
jgi:hypothetical protein